MRNAQARQWLLQVEETCSRMAPMLHGLGPERQAAILATLTGRWLAGWNPDLRDEMLDSWIILVRKLADQDDVELYGPAGFPKDGLQ